MKQTINHLIEALKAQPLALALVALNAVFLIVFSLVLREVSQGIERRDAMIERCLNK